MKQAVHLLKSRALGMAIMLVLTALSVLLFRDGGVVEVMHADAQTGVPLPILMYHSVLKDPQRSGSYIITPAQFEKDMLYLNEHGYTAVLPSDLLRYAKGDGELPEKPVMITFDDGYYNNLVYVLPILKRLQLKAVVSIVGSYADEATARMDANPTYAHLTWEDVSTIAASGYVEIASHSFALHSTKNGRNGVKRKPGESETAYEAILTEDIEQQRCALYEHCGIATTVFTYPFGQWDKDSEALLRKMGFSMTLTCRERMNYIERNPASLFRLGRYNRPSGVSTETFMQKALKG